MLRTELIAPIAALLHRQAERRGTKIAYRDAHGAISYAQLLASTAHLASHLQAHGLTAGDRVAIWLPNSVAWVQSCFAAARAGGVSVPISYDAVEPEVLYRLTDAACKVIVTTDERAPIVARLRAQAPELRTVILVDRGERSSESLRFADLIATSAGRAPLDPDAMHDPAYIVYTSGTTGRAKGVVLTHHGMLWVAASCWAPMLGLSADDYVLSPLPLFHSYALNLSVLSILATGASEYIMERYSTQEAIRRLDEERCTFFPGVPTMFHYLLQALPTDALSEGTKRFPHLRLAISAGAIMPATLNREFEARTGTLLLDGYGITETSTMVVCNWPTGTRVPGSCGLPIPGLAARIVDATTDRDQPAGTEGELILRGPCVMLGYHQRPAETAAALRDGWYRTGDLARADENGYITITGRLKELVIRGGQNIAPAEIEEVVSTLDGVLDCAVIGIEHPHLGEVPVICVVEKPGTKVSVDALLAHCRAQLSAYKVPEAVHIVSEIPRTGSGKIMRYKLKERLA